MSVILSVKNTCDHVIAASLIECLGPTKEFVAREVIILIYFAVLVDIKDVLVICRTRPTFYVCEPSDAFPDDRPLSYLPPLIQHRVFLLTRW